MEAISDVSQFFQKERIDAHEEPPGDSGDSEDGFDTALEMATKHVCLFCS